MTLSPPPYVPKNPLLPVVGEHTLVQTLGTPGVSLERTELDRLTASLWRHVHDLERTRTHPLSVLEIASRSGLSRGTDRKSTRLNSSHVANSYAVFCFTKKN